MKKQELKRKNLNNPVIKKYEESVDKGYKWNIPKLKKLAQKVKEDEEGYKTLCIDCCKKIGTCHHCDKRAKAVGKCDRCGNTFNYA